MSYRREIKYILSINPPRKLLGKHEGVIFFAVELQENAEKILHQWITDCCEKLDERKPVEVMGLSRARQIQWFFSQEGHGSYYLTPCSAMENARNFFDAYHEIADPMLNLPKSDGSN